MGGRGGVQGVDGAGVGGKAAQGPRFESDRQHVSLGSHRNNFFFFAII